MTMTTTLYLDHAAVDAAMQYLEETYGPYKPGEKDEWLEVLPHLRPGELRPVLDRWVDVPPRAYAVLDYISTNRHPAVEPADREPPPRRERKITPEIQAIIDQARADINRARAR